MTHEELKALLPLAVLNRLEADEEAQLAEHLRAACDECEAELREFREAAASLALAAEPAGFAERVAARLQARLAAPGASPDLAAALNMDRAAAQRSKSGAARGARTTALRLALAAVLLLAVYGAGVTVQLFGVKRAYRDQLAFFEDRFSSLQNQAERAERRVDAMSQSLADTVRLEQVFGAADTQIIRLDAVGHFAGAHAVIAVSRTTATAVIDESGLPPAPQGRIYELWWITPEGRSVPAGLFNGDGGQAVIEKVQTPPAGQRVIVCEITEEPAGGGAKPSDTMDLKGSL